MGFPLPVELLRPIFSYVHVDDSQGLLSVIHSSHLFRFEAEPLLYRDIDTRRDWPFPGSRLFYRPQDVWKLYHLPRLASLLTTIGRNQHLASFVRHFNVDLHAWAEHEDAEYPGPQDPDIMFLFSVALPRLVNLTSLTVNIANSTTRAQEFSRTLARCSFHLESFVWQAQGDREHFIKFLARQQSLKDLCVWRIYPDPRNDTMLYLPNLVAFEGGYESCLAFLPCSPVIATLTFVAGLDGPRQQAELPPEDVLLLAPALSRLETLRWWDVYHHLQHLQHRQLSMLSRYLTSLKTLHVIKPARREELEIIISMKTLRQVRFESFGFEGSEESEVGSVVAMFEHLEHLEIVDVKSKDKTWTRYLRAIGNENSGMMGM